MDIARIQAYLRHLAGAMYVVGRAPGFRTFFHATDDMRHVNYAIPDADWERAGGGSFALLRREFEGRSRLPRLEFIEEFAPTLPDAARRPRYATPTLCDADVLATPTFGPTLCSKPLPPRNFGPKI